MTNEELKDFSALLKTEREAKKITLKEIADSSKINIKFLEAIESGDFEVMPEVYIRAFLKTYAKYVGLNPDKVINDFDLAKRNKFGKTAETSTVSAVEKSARKSESEFTEEKEEEEKKKGILLFSAIAAIVLIALAILFFFPEEEEKPPEETSFEEILKEKNVEAQNAVPVAEEKNAERKNPIEVRIDAEGQCWIGVRADADTSSSQFMLTKGNKKLFTANDSMRIVFGMPSSVKVLFNGKEINVVKKRGEISEVKFYKTEVKISIIKASK